MLKFSIIVIVLFLGLVKSKPFVLDDVHVGKYIFTENGVSTVVKRISTIHNDCTVEKKENAIFFLIDSKVKYGVLNSDNTITESNCEFFELSDNISNKIFDTRKILSFKISMLFDEFADYVLHGFYCFVLALCGWVVNSLWKVGRFPCTSTCFKNKEKNQTPNLNTQQSQSTMNSPQNQYPINVAATNNMHSQQNQPSINMQSMHHIDTQPTYSTISGHPYLTRQWSDPNSIYHFINASAPDYAERASEKRSYGQLPESRSKRSMFNSTVNDLATVTETQNTTKITPDGRKTCNCPKITCQTQSCSCFKAGLPCIEGTCHPNKTNVCLNK